MILVSFALAGPAADVLRQRDASPCIALGPSSVALREELVGLAEASDGVPWIAVRAARCLAEQFPSDPLVLERFVTWAPDSSRAGLTLVVLESLDAWAPSDTSRVASAALSLPDARWHARFVRLIAENPSPEVRATLGVDAPAAAD